jgi:5'(3')-deoxyribonucleotidase
MHIGIDLDNTLADLATPWLKRINQHLGTSFQHHHWKDWEASFLHPHGITNSTVYLHPNIYQEVDPIPKAITAAREILKMTGVTVSCVTANIKNSPEEEQEYRKAKIKWLETHLPELSDKVIFATVKTGLGLDILIDDGPHHFEHPKDHPGGFTGILVDQPWNKHVKTPHIIQDWHHAPKIVEKVVQKIKRPLHIKIPGGIS